MSVKGQIDRLSQAKTDIAAALIAKGLAVSTDIGLDKIPDLILKLGNGTSAPLTGTVDNNIITLAGGLTNGTYTLRYYNNGEYIDIGTLTVSGGASTAPDTTVEITKGMKIDSSTGAETTGTSLYSASNYIEIVDGFDYTVIRAAGRSFSVMGCKVCYYDANKSFMKTSGDVISQDGIETQVSAQIPIIDGAKYFRLRIYGTVSLTTNETFTVTATKE